MTAFFPALSVALLAFFGNTPKSVLWSDPGPVRLIDFRYGAGGATPAPKPPFHFIEEDLDGTSPKVLVRDSAGVTWLMKGGLDARPEAFVTRLVSALGYYATPTWFLAKGRVEGTNGLKRASGFIEPDGTFTYAALQSRQAGVDFRSDLDWSWEDSTFTGSRELNGLKILMMLVSNWDNKDARDRRRGSNVGVMQFGAGENSVLRYFVTDWGQSLGAWGRFYGRKQWDCSAFQRQNREFIRGIRNGRVQFGYGGQHTVDFRSGITSEDVRWLMQYLGEVTDSQLHVGLAACGATPQEEDCFAKALRERIEQLRKIAVVPSHPGTR